MEVLSFLIALLSGLLFFGTGINAGIAAFIVATGIDPQRSRLIAALLSTAGIALLAGFIGRRKPGACIGAGLAFWFAYLTTFMQNQLLPAHDPGGNLEPLNVGALIHTVSIMAALAFLAAFIGATLGIAFSEVILNPPLRLIQRAWRQRFAQPQEQIVPYLDVPEVPAPRPVSTSSSIFPWLGAGVLIVLFVLAASSGPLFIYSPSVGLHNPPQTSSGNQNLPTQGTLLQETMISQALGGQSETFYVYLPPSYYVAQGQNKHYPTLYLLHGSPGTYKDWITAGNANQSADTLISTGKIPELIMVIPDGNGQISPSEWGNSFNQQQLIETFVASDLVKYVDQKFRTIPQAAERAIGGLSMGGFGAMNIAVQHPDVFGSVIALGGYYRADGSVWGNNTSYIQQNSPIDYLPNHQQAWKLYVFLGAATQDSPYYADTLEFAHTLDSLSIPYHLDIQQGSHAWSVWQVQLYNALQWLKWG